MKSYLHLIRHGITEGIIRKWYYGSTDLPLIEEGFRELENLKSQGIYPSADGADCYTSGMLRANQTFEAIYGKLPYTPMSKMREMDFGKWECKTFEELKKEDGFDDWMNDKDGSFHYPCGDSILSFYARIQDGLNEIHGLHRLKELSHRHCGKDAVSILVCHGGTIAASMQYWFPDERDNFWQWIPKVGRGFTIEFKDGDPYGFDEI